MHANVLGVWGPEPGGIGGSTSFETFRQILRPYTIHRFIGNLSVYVENGGDTGGLALNHAFGVAKTAINIAGTNEPQWRAQYSVMSPSIRIGWEAPLIEYSVRPAGTQSNQFFPIHYIDQKVGIRVERFHTPFLSTSYLVQNNGSSTDDQINVRFAGKCLVSRDLG